MESEDKKPLMLKIFLVMQWILWALWTLLAVAVVGVLAVVKLVRVRSAVVNLAIDYVYYSVASSGDDDRPCCLYAAAPYLG